MIRDRARPTGPNRWVGSEPAQSMSGPVAQTGHGDREHGDIDRGMQAEQGGDEQGDRERGEGVVVVVHEVSLSVEEEVWCAVRWVRVDKVRAG